ncbi:RNA 2',3'-cyclic phosphodiesterase [Sphingomonas solaris]|uniref:RNA 2',3'-cyclic phosphodiesterase n=1 Tax=Alterirhizorhabdus solaris TaxID=2529389 RepID=A0A558R799_9SPHN|nr:RNA 2',3'-cyclic phosphodiesterase [Sphingomonas solaris]TVV75270.1 RNA 2',3'-cyclic phosphodiesterase [Sphingomonas solaris]
MHRLFVALRPPAAMRARLRSLQGGIAGARWQDDAQLHLTLRFIGAVDRHVGEDIAAALGAVHFPRFALALDRIGCFDRHGRIDSLWAGVTPADDVTRLHAKVTQALARVGIAPEGRAYLPHLTIARFSRAAAPAMVPTGPIVSETYEMTEFCLYESVLGRDGATYLVIERYPLA